MQHLLRPAVVQDALPPAGRAEAEGRLAAAAQEALAGLDAVAEAAAAVRAAKSRLVAALPAGFPVILYAKGTASHFAAQAASGVRAISVDWTADLAAVRTSLPANIALQGNLDPVLMTTTPDIVRSQTTRLLASMRGRSGHIFNLGHGITPDAKLECMSALVETVTSFR